MVNEKQPLARGYKARSMDILNHELMRESRDK
jgi:hypothetical protein